VVLRLIYQMFSTLSGWLVLRARSMASVVLDETANDALPPALWYVVTLGPAVLNVALHAALVKRRRRRA
jgi:hypothetical protein